MHRRIAALCLVALGALALTPGAASAATPTQVKSVKVFTVDGRTSVDVGVRYPDAGARKVSARAVNRGSVSVVVKDADGNVLADAKGSAKLPVDVPKASSVLHTYRFALPATVGDAKRLTVSVDADGDLDPDGPGPADAINDGDTDDVDVDPQDLPTAPLAYQYHVIRFSVSCDRDRATQCPIVFGHGSDSNAPFDKPRPTTPPGTLLLTHGARQGIKFIENQTGAHSYLNGSVPDFSRAEFSVTSAIVPSWGKGIGHTGTTAAAGQPGGPLYLQINGAGWSTWGYIGFS